MDVLCDTSFLMVLVSTPTKHIDKVESELGNKLNFLVPTIVIDELKHLQLSAGPKRSKMAELAIEISNSKLKVIDIIKTGHVDDALIDYAVNHGCAAATIDKSLRRRLIASGVPVITLNRNKFIFASLSTRDNFKF
jgi:rRNA-processing protein FCF1